MRILWLFFGIPCTFLMPVLVLIPISGYTNCGQIQLILNFCLHILFTFFWFPQSCEKYGLRIPPTLWFLIIFYSCISCNYLYITYLYFSLTYFFQHTPMSLYNSSLVLMIWLFCLLFNFAVLISYAFFVIYSSFLIP